MDMPEESADGEQAIPLCPVGCLVGSVAGSCTSSQSVTIPVAEYPAERCLVSVLGAIATDDHRLVCQGLEELLLGHEEVQPCE